MMYGKFFIRDYSILTYVWITALLFRTAIAVSADPPEPFLPVKGKGNSITEMIIENEKVRTLKLADLQLSEKPVTVTASICLRSAGGKHDYYSDGDYWWPDPQNPGGPYIRRDGLSNPDNFKDHRKALGHFSWIVGTQTSAYLLTGDEKYVNTAMSHLRAWFVDTSSRMNPHLLYAQAITGVSTGRGIGIIDATSLIEVAQSVMILEKSPFVSGEEIFQIKEWFREFLNWLTTHEYGIDEMNWENNHGTWWHAQAAVYAKLTGNKEVIDLCKDHFINSLLPKQMVENGSFPLELERTKPFSYSLFNMEGMSSLAWILSGREQNLFTFQLPDGRGIQKGVDFILPYIKNKESWPYPKDISNWDLQPRRCQFLIYAAIALNNPDYFYAWKVIDDQYPDDESRRNSPIKNPLLWISLPDLKLFIK